MRAVAKFCYPRAPYAIYCQEKVRTIQAFDGMGRHNNRAHYTENVDPDGPPPEELMPGAGTTLERVKRRLVEKEIDPDSLKNNVGVEIVVSVSPVWLESASAEQKADWIKTNFAYLHKEHGDGLVSVIVHRDEKTLHMHAAVLALKEHTPKPRGRPSKDPAEQARKVEEAAQNKHWTISYDAIFGGKRDRLSERQDIYYEAVKHLGLVRGLKDRRYDTIEIAEGFEIDGAPYDKGVDANGRQRPRGSISPKEGRDLLFRECGKATAEREAAQRARRLAEAANYEAQALLAEASLQLTFLELSREEAERQLQRIRDDEEEARAKMADDRAEAERVRRDAEQQLDADRTAFARECADEEQRLDDYRTDVLGAVKDARIAKHEAERKLQQAERDQEEVRLELASVAKTRQELDKGEAQLAAERELHHAQVQLIASALDNPKERLAVDADGHIVMTSDALGPDERATLHRPWSGPTAKLRSALLGAFDNLRSKLVALTAREEAVGATEAANLQQQGRLAARQESLEVALTQLAIREAESAAKVAAAECRKRDAEDSEAKANEAARTAREETQRQQAWGAIIEQTEDEKVILAVDASGHVSVASREHDVVWSPAMSEAVKKTPPNWVRQVVEAQQSVRSSQGLVTERLGEAYKISSELEKTLHNVNTQLSPTQATAVEQGRHAQARASAAFRDHQERLSL